MAGSVLAGFIAMVVTLIVTYSQGAFCARRLRGRGGAASELASERGRYAWFLARPRRYHNFHQGRRCCPGSECVGVWAIEGGRQPTGR